ncbi:MAG TPA: ABC transporter permease [Candidatus Acidoferrales bacterium]|nr:ABC transporter permease [Candidatus Acidoferrales bacterium]
METLLQDLKFGSRLLVKSPGFASVAILTLALGIGANTAIFSLIDAVLLRSLPVRAPRQLVVFGWKALHDPDYHNYSNYGDCGSGGSGSGCSFSVPLFERMHSRANVFSGLTAFAGPMDFNLSGNGPARMAKGELVSGDFFATLGVNSILGRTLGPADDSPSAPPALVLSYGFWKSAFGGERAAIGRVIRLNTVPFTIVGVAEPGFTNLAPGKTQDFFLPLAATPRLKIRWFGDEAVLTDPRTWWVVLLGRLKPGISPEQAQAAASTIFTNEMLHGAKPLSKPGDKPAVALTPALEGLTGQRRQLSTALFVLMAAVGLILLIACANVAGLMLARSAARQKELAVRLALGAGRGRIAGQLLTESVMLSVLGGALGVFLAYGGVHAITALVSNGADRPFPFVVAPDWRVLAFVLGVSLMTGLLFGLLPTFRGARIDLTPSLKEGSSAAPGGGALSRGRRIHLGGALVVAQVALSILALSGAGLLVRSLRNLRGVNPGFDTRNVLLFGIDPTLAGYTDAQISGLYRHLEDRFAALPGVVSASYSSNVLVSGFLWTTEVHLDGQPANSNVRSDMLAVGPGFFSTMRIPLLAGRAFSPADFALAASAAAAEKAARAASAAAAPPSPKRPAAAPGPPSPIVVNEAFAREYFGGANPVGKHIGDYQGPEADNPNSPGYRIIGLAGNTKYNNLRREIQPTMYRPLVAGGAHFELRAAADPAALIPVVRGVVGEVDANLPLFDLRTQSEQIEQGLSQQRIMAQLSSFFGLLALALACIGLYGVLAYDVARRTREIGIRVALGARPASVLRLVVGQGLGLAFAGAAIGAGAAAGLTRFLSSFLYGVRPGDLGTTAAVVLLLALVAIAACIVPARRALRVDPVRALRYE